MDGCRMTFTFAMAANLPGAKEVKIGRGHPFSHGFIDLCSVYTVFMVLIRFDLG